MKKTYRELIQNEANRIWPNAEYTTYRLFKNQFIKNCLWLLKELNIDPDSYWKRALPESNEKTETK